MQRNRKEWLIKLKGDLKRRNRDERGHMIRKGGANEGMT